MTRWTRAVGALSLVIALAALVACGKDGPASSKAGEVTLNLTTPFADDGAILISVTGPEIGTVRASSSALAVHSRAVAGGVRVAVFGDIASGSLLRIAVPDASQSSRYSASVIEVSDRANGVRPVLTGYKAKVE